MVVLTLGFATGYSAFSTNITLNAKGNIKEKSRIIRSWTSDSVDDFHNSQYRENIVSATFLDSTNLPSNVENSWDVSSDGKGGVIAYVKMNEEDHTKYDLFIGAKNGVIANENSSYIFYNFTNIQSINFNNNFDTSDTIYMNSMFRYCLKLNKLDLTNFNTTKVIDMGKMFAGDNASDPEHTRLKMAITEIKGLDKFYTGNVTNMGGMFRECGNLTNVNVSSFNTSNVTNMSSMFEGCNSLLSLDVSNFNTSKVTTMSSMFASYKGNALDISNFDTSKVTSMGWMFYALNVEELDISNFDTGKVTNMTSMFWSCKNLKKIYVDNKFVTTNVTSSAKMFEYDTNLVGGNGTIFDSNHIDKEYARIDTASTPGYFTLKQ